MKILKAIILVLLTTSNLVLEQESQLDKETSELFFNLYLNTSLKQLIKSPDLELIYLGTILADETYKADFNEHPKIHSDFKSG